jgi:hypothetical protein
MKNHALTLFALTFGLAPAALAQPQPPPNRSEASAREVAYGERLAKALERTGAGAVKPVREQAEPWRSSLTTPPPVGNGIRLDLGDLEVTRLKFDSPEAAQMHVHLIRGELNNPLTAEVRGDQVVVARGPALSDPAVARRVRGSFWEGLPAPDATDATLTHLGPGNYALSTRLTTGPLRRFIDKMNGSVHEWVRNHEDGARAPDETQGAFDGPDEGRRLRVRSDRDGGSYWCAVDPEIATLVSAQFDAQDGHPAPEPVHTARGARQVLDDLLTPRPHRP